MLFSFVKICYCGTIGNVFRYEVFVLKKELRFDYNYGE